LDYLLQLCIYSCVAGEELLHEALLLLLERGEVGTELGEFAIGGGEDGGDGALFAYRWHVDFDLEKVLGWQVEESIIADS